MILLYTSVISLIVMHHVNLPMMHPIKFLSFVTICDSNEYHTVMDDTLILDWLLSFELFHHRVYRRWSGDASHRFLMYVPTTARLIIL